MISSYEESIRVKVYFAAWKFLKLMEVIVSSDPHEAKVPGHVVLVSDGFVALVAFVTSTIHVSQKDNIVSKSRS